MKFWRNLSRRGLSMFLALVMCISLLQVTAFAEESDSLEPAPSISESTQAEESTEPSTPDVDVDADTDVDVDTDTDVNVDIDTDVDVDTDTDVNVDTDTDVDVDTDTDVNVDTDTDVDVDTDTDVDVDTDTDVDVDTDTDVDVDTDTDVDVDTDTKPSTPNYATKDELEAAFDAVSEALEGEDVKGGIAAIDKYLSIYNSLSPEDKAANAEAYAGMLAYQEMLKGSLEGIPDPEIETPKYVTYKSHITLYAGDGNPTGTKMSVGDHYNGNWYVEEISTNYVKFGSQYGEHNNSFLVPYPEQIWTGVSSNYQTKVTYCTAFSRDVKAGANGIVLYTGGTATYQNVVNTGGSSSSNAPYVTIVHEYYTNGKLDGCSDPEYQSVTAPTYNVPKTVYTSDIKSRVPEYNGNTYAYKSMSSNPSTVTVAKDATGNQGTFTLRYERTASGDPGTRAGNFTVKKSFAGLADGVDTPQVELTYEAYRTRDGNRVRDLEQDTVTLTKQNDGTYTGIITPTVWDILTGESGMSEKERDRYKNVIVITEDLDSAKVDGYSLQSFGPVYSADGSGSGASVTFVLDGATFAKILGVKNTYSIEAPKTITVTWMDGYTDTPIKQVTIDPDGDYSKLYPSEPTREGYYFTGWGEPVTDKDGNITITAQWKELTYRVEWYVVSEDEAFKAETRNGAALGEEVSVTDDDKTVENKGYQYVGDDYNENGIQNVLSATLEKENTVLKLYFTKEPPKPTEAEYKVEW